MKLIKTVTILAVIIFFTACKKEKSAENKNKPQEQETHQKHQEHWSYTGENNPKNWSHIKEEYVACDGNSQSPIDINSTAAIHLEKNNEFVLNYSKSTIEILNNGHTEEFIISKGNTLKFNGKTYELKQFHMHTLSEHTVDGKHFPLEIHFVNKAEDNTYAVISVLVKEGETSPFLATYLDKFPDHEGKYTEEGKFNITDVLPNVEHFYHYKGSFTTPPCTEEVEWIVLKENPTASKEQLEKLHKLMHDNYRPTQELNGRKIDNQ